MIRGNDILLGLGFLLALPTFFWPVGIINGFEVTTQGVYLFQQDAWYKLALLFPLLSYLFLVLRRQTLTTSVTVFYHAALSLIGCIDMVFLYFRFHFAEPDPTWIALTFLLGYTLLFLGHLKNLFFPYEFLRAYQPHLPVRQPTPPSAWETWGVILLVGGVLLGFQGYYAQRLLGAGTPYLLIIAGTIELTPVQRVQALLGLGLVASVGGLLALFKPKPIRRLRSDA